MIIEIRATGGLYTLPIKGFLGGISWGDGASSSCTPLPGQPPCDEMTHYYSTPGNYTIRVGVGNSADTFTGLGNGCDGQPSGGFITSITSWGDFATNNAFTSLSGAFSGETELLSVPTNLPSYVNTTACMFNGANMFDSPNVSAWDTSSVMDMSGMFMGASSFDQPLSTWQTGNVVSMSSMFKDAYWFNRPVGNWNVSSVANFSGMFAQAVNFNQPLSSWNTANAVSMSEMFADAGLFNQPINQWDTSNVVWFYDMFNNAGDFNQPLDSWDMTSAVSTGGMFYLATSFNQDIESWSMGSVQDIHAMFQFATSFNQPLNNWNVGQVTTFSGLFADAVAFNQPLNNWNTGNATDMGWMFTNATSFDQQLNSWDTSHVQFLDNMFNLASSFDQSLAGWNITSVVNAPDMFALAPISTTNYSSTLVSWGAQNVVHNVSLGMIGAHYLASAQSGHQALLNAGWVINDLGLQAITPSSSSSSNNSTTVSAPLASTGFNPLPPLFAGTLLLIFGTALLVWRQRKS